MQTSPTKSASGWLARLEEDVASTVRAVGITPVHTTSSEGYAEGGVVISRSMTDLVVSWRMPVQHGCVEGHTVHQASKDAGRVFLRRVLEAHAMRHGWWVVPETDLFAASPVRIRWAADDTGNPGDVGVRL